MPNSFTSSCMQIALATFRPHKIGDKRCRRLMRWKPRSRVARMARVARGSIDIETFGNWKKWLQDVASRDRWTKSDTATPRHQEQSRPKEVLKRQDQLGHGKRKHFDESEWKKKCSNFTKCGKPNEQLSRYNQTVTVGKWFGNVFSTLERESYSRGPFRLHTAN